MRIWGKVLLWLAVAGVLSSGAESFQVFPQACVEVPGWERRKGGWVVGGIGVEEGER
jgi:hypothetical protein